MTATIDAKALHELIEGPGEIALIDVREEAVYGAEHMLFAANIPLSQLELRVPDLIPRKGTPIVVCDAGEGLAERAAEKISSWGYPDVTVLAGGVKGWGAAGLELFSGLNVPSKAFGEFVEHVYGTPSVSAEELKAMMDGGEKLVVLDSRPMGEYRVMNIPTGVDCPGAELVFRVQEVAPDPDTTVVVNCAGRTRSIIGAQSLINAGIPNKVVALRNGTMGWHLAGLKLEHGKTTHAPDPSAEGKRVALERAEAAAKRFGVKRTDSARLDQWRKERDDTTLYLLDVRTVEEFEAGHIADSRHAPGGQLVQGTDTYIVTRNARVVLVDDQMVRALMTASWLVQLGWDEVYVLESGLQGQKIAEGARSPEVPGLDQAPKPIAATEARRRVGAGSATLVDLSRSLTYREEHPEGAKYGIRANLAADLERAGVTGAVITTAADPALAALAAADLVAAGRDAVSIDGGNAAWVAAGLPTAAGLGDIVSTPTDAYLRAYDRTDPKEVEKAMHAYLDWEIALVAQIARPGGVTFKEFPPMENQA
jgi:rhodanese-related sulfurtransferase